MSDQKTSLLTLTSPAEIDLFPVRLDAREAISEMFEVEIDAVATGAIDPRTMLNKAACLSIDHAGTPTRHFHGIISRFGIAETRGVVDTVYRLVLRPQLVQADIREDCRLFFNKTAEEIIRTILDEAGVTKTAFRLYSKPALRKSTAQYNETALHFIVRLMEEEGWFYFFEHTSDGHTLVIANDNKAFPTIADASVRVLPGAIADMLTTFRSPEALTHGKISLRDYDPDAPGKNLKVDQNTILKHGGTGSRGSFHWPALTRDTGHAKERAKWRMEAAEAAVSLIEGASGLASLVAGGKFKLIDEAESETPYVIRAIHHRADDDARRSQSGQATYENSFTAFANSVPWRQPMTTARPRMEGLHTAIVLAPSGEEIHTDDQGRVKVRFFWDWREDATADSSDWVRVVQPWAGNKWGGQFIPRVGTEVAVAFMDGDPDRPVVVGGLYNADDKPIFPVAEKTKMGFRSRSSTQGGTDDFNELSFDDATGSELVYMHVQKDMKTKVKNDQTLIVKNDRTVTIEGKETVTITGDQSTTLKLGDLKVKAELGAITMEAMQSITLKVGMSTLTVNQMGIELKGMMIKIDGTIQTQLKGLMVDVNASGILTLKGTIMMLN